MREIYPGHEEELRRLTEIRERSHAWEYGRLVGPWNGFGPHWAFMAVFWGLLIWGAVSLFRLASRPSAATGAKSEQPALAILKRRCTRGEVGREQFEATQKELR